MPIRACPVCSEGQNSDDKAFQHHVNSHFSRPGTDHPEIDGAHSGSSSPRKRRFSEFGKEEIKQGDLTESEWEQIKIQEIETLDDNAACPLCFFPFNGTSVTEREQHVNMCMDSQPNKSESPEPPLISHRPSRDFQQPRPASIPLQIDTGQTERHCQLDTSFHLSDQLIQQSRASGHGQNQGQEVIAEDWDGPAKPGGFAEWRRGKVEKGDRWWDPLEGKIGDVPENFSSGLIPVLQQILKSSVHKGQTRSAVLGREAVAISGVWRYDMTWGCGYRNALMLLSSLILHSPPLASLFSRESNGSDPGVRRLQGWMDEAWSKGFDPEGKAHFGGKVLGGSRWIGTGDLYALFSYKGVSCDLYDFPKPKKAGARPAHKALTEWMKQYFDEGLPSHPIVRRTSSSSSATHNAFDVMMMCDQPRNRGSAVRRADRYPVILQHNGHSRTVVGYEETARGDINLFIFDPGKPVPAYLRDAGLRHTASNRQKPAVRPISTPQAHQEQQLSHKASHASIPFSPPYTNGASEITQWRDPANVDDDISMTSPIRTDPSPGAQRLEGGTRTTTAGALEEDELMDERGWVRKRVDKVTRSGDKANSKGKEKGDSALGRPNETGQGDMEKGLKYFRVNLGALGRVELNHLGSQNAEYQVLAVTGDQPLSIVERNRRKYLTSTVIA